MPKMTMAQKADLALGDLSTDGGLLNPEQQDQFIRFMIDQPTLLREARTVPMNSPEMRINKIGFGSRILRPAPQAGVSGSGDSGADPIEPRCLRKT